jgi:hypothetical protein
MENAADTVDPDALFVREAAASMSSPELSRRIGWILEEAAKKVAVPLPDGACVPLESLAYEIMLAVKGGAKLPAGDYRAVYGIWSIFRRHARERQHGLG